MENVTKKITTPGGLEVVLKEKITAGARNKLRNILLSSAKFDEQQKMTSEITGSTIEKVEHALIEIVVVSLGGSADNVLGRLLDAAPEDYDCVIEQANKIANFTMAKSPTGGSGTSPSEVQN